MYIYKVSIAQLVEHALRKRKVARSNPAARQPAWSGVSDTLLSGGFRPDLTLQTSVCTMKNHANHEIARSPCRGVRSVTSLVTLACSPQIYIYIYISVSILAQGISCFPPPPRNGFVS